MTRTYRLAGGLMVLGIAAAVGLGPDAASAESLGGRDDASVPRAGVVSTGTATKKAATQKTAAARTTTRDDTAIGFTGSAGTKSYTIAAANAVVVNRIGRGDDASMPVMHAVFRTSKPEPQAAPGRSTRPYHAQIEKHARANGVPVALALAVIRVESNYNPRARGRAGEVGLMQIKPRTARGMGFSGSAAALYDPETNLRWGMKYLAGAYRLAGGDTCGTIMRYQGGHYARRMSKAAAVYCGKVKRHMSGQWT